MKKDYSFYIGYITTIVLAILLTPLYAVCITLIRSFAVLIDIIWDSFTFMPKATFEYEKSYEKRYWERELDRINKKFKDN